MIYKRNKTNIGFNIYSLNFKFVNDNYLEFTDTFKPDPKNTIKINVPCNGIGKHGLRIKVMNGTTSQCEIPINSDTGVATYDKTKCKISQAKKLAKLLSGFSKLNLKLLNEYFGYRDQSGNIIHGDPSVEKDLKDAIKNFNKLSISEKKNIEIEGEVKTV